MSKVIKHDLYREVRAMKRLILFILIIVSASILIHPLPTVQARGGCERTGIVNGAITFVDLVCDVILYVPHFVFVSLIGPGNGYCSQRDRHHFSHDSSHYGKGYDKKDRRGRKGRGKRH